MNTAFEAQMRMQLGPEATAFFTALEQPYQRGFRFNPRKTMEQTPDGTLDPVPWWPVYGRYLAADSAAGLDRFPLYLGGIWLLCAVLRKLDLDAALPLRSTMTWGFVVLTWMGGAAACLCKKLRRA